MPILWALLISALPGDAGLLVGWFSVLPVILFVPVGIIATLALAIAAAVQAQRTGGGHRSVESEYDSPR